MDREKELNIAIKSNISFLEENKTFKNISIKRLNILEDELIQLNNYIKELRKILLTK